MEMATGLRSAKCSFCFGMIVSNKLAQKRLQQCQIDRGADLPIIKNEIQKYKKTWARKYINKSTENIASLQIFTDNIISLFSRRKETINLKKRGKCVLC